MAKTPVKNTPATSTPRPAADAAQKTLQLGVIGVDSSHLAEFSRRINTLFKDRQTRCHVTQMWTDGRHDMPDDDVETWRLRARGHGVVDADDLDAMLDAVDGVMVLTVNGARHLDHAAPALRRGLPTYIDKPLTCDLAEARTLLALSREHEARCYSASSLRFADEVAAIDREALGDLVAIDAYGPGELNDAMPRLFHYGVHTIEMVDAIWGRGVRRVRAHITEPRDHVELEYHDGRYARLRMERVGAYDFGATLHGTESVASFRVDFSEVYNRLVAGMVRFFEGGRAPARLEAIVENIAVMEAAHRSIAHGGGWVELSAMD